MASLVQNMIAADIVPYSLASGEAKAALSTEQEKELARLWGSILGLSPTDIGSNDDWFQNGGDSFSAMKLVSLAAERSSLQLSVGVIFQHSQLSDMALQLQPLDAGQGRQQVQPFSLTRYSTSEIARMIGLDEQDFEDAYATTPLQEGFMSITSRQPQAYVGRMVFEIPITVDSEKLQDAWNSTAAQWPILRTRIVPTPVASLQVVLKQFATCRHVSDSLDRWIDEDKKKPMSWGKELSRTMIVEDAEADKKYLVWTASHAVYDGHTFERILETVVKAYHGSAVPSFVPFVDFISYLVSMDQNEGEQFWRRSLEGELPSAFPQLESDAQITANARMSHRMKVDFSAYKQLLPSVILRAAWSLLLAHHTASDLVIFATTLSGRNANLQDIENVAGPTLTTMPLKIKLDQVDTVQDYLQKLQSGIVDMIPHEHWGMQNLSSLSDEARQAVGQVRHLFMVQPMQMHGTLSPLDTLGIRANNMPADPFDAYALNVECFVDANEILIETQYDERVIPTAQLQQMLRQFEHFTMVLSRDAYRHTQVRETPSASAEDSAIIRSWNGSYPKKINECVHRIISSQAQRTPSAQAVCSHDGDLTYGRLDELSDNLGHFLASKGVGPEIKVPLAFEKSTWAIVSQVAVLKAGGTFVSIGASQPRERLERILKDTAAPLILCSVEHVDALADYNLEVIPVSGESATALPAQPGEPCTTVTPSNGAYIIYSSGYDFWDILRYLEY